MEWLADFHVQSGDVHILGQSSQSSPDECIGTKYIDLKFFLTEAVVLLLSFGQIIDPSILIWLLAETDRIQIYFWHEDSQFY